ncbi:MAG TPA: aldose 1-epimerase family protein [Candidatus Hydrogenedentes bacterium]|nr:aldose 1-epimerase family protein [Candidatus Hydrogenedentota bacterium]HIJ74221.1 aldose 1-epimerase family protein [Candidatus Hydrogenedentota bacterium]
MLTETRCRYVILGVVLGLLLLGRTADADGSVDLYGKTYRTDHLRRRVGSMDQIAGIRVVQLDEANERPTRAALFHTGSGLEFTVLLDRCLDIAAASFQGKAMGWRSTTGDVAPQYYEPEGLRWLRSFYGGPLTTCGLTHVGAPSPEEPLLVNGLHGRIANIPARNIKVAQEWQGDDYVLSITGTMRETTVFGENLTLTRTVSTKLGERRLWVRDVLKNEGFKETPYQILYHWNIGWPSVDDGSRLLAASRFVAPRDAEAVADKENYNNFHAPTHGYKEKVYYHDMVPEPDGTVTVAIINNGFDAGNGFGVYLKYNKNELPRFSQWKQMGEQDYVVGFEPANCSVEGRQVDAALGLLHVLAPGEIKTFHFEFGPITSKQELAAIRDAIPESDPQLVESYKEFVKKP